MADNNMEIERKYLVKCVPDNLDKYEYHIIEQAYLCTSPVVRIRRQDDDFYLTYKSSGLMAHEEYNLPLDSASYEHLLKKADGNIITKKRFLIPLDDTHTIELDVFDGIKKGLILAEVEFSSVEDANIFIPPEWFDKDVTLDPQYHNSVMSMQK